MSDTIYQPRGRFFEEFNEGDVIVTAGRTITESDVMRFASLSGDFNQIHTDAEFAGQGLFGERVAHGLLVLSIASGLATQTGIIEGTVLAFRQVEWKFSKPVLFNDTIHVKITVHETKPARRLGGGTVKMKVTVHNQRNETVQRGTWVMLVKSKDSE